MTRMPSAGCPPCRVGRLWNLCKQGRAASPSHWWRRHSPGTPVAAGSGPAQNAERLVNNEQAAVRSPLELPADAQALINDPGQLMRPPGARPAASLLFP